MLRQRDIPADVRLAISIGVHVSSSDGELMLQLVQACLEGQVVPMLWGAPGIGKTSFARALAAVVGVRSFVICLSHKEGVEVHGAQVVSSHQFTYAGHDYTVVEQAPPKYVREAVAEPKGAIIVYDELTTVPPPTAGPSLAIFSERVIGEVAIPPDKIGIIACANPSDQAAGGWSLSPPMANRICHLQFRVSPGEWADEFPIYWGHAPTLSLWGETVPEEDWIQARSLVAAYIRANPETLLRVPKQSESGEMKGFESVPHGRSGPWPSPRTWDFVSRLLVTSKRRGLSAEDRQQLIVGSIGPGAAGQFLTWLDQMDLPDPRYLLDHPDSFQLPSRNDQTYYVMKGVTAECLHRKQQADEKPTDRKLAERAVQAWYNCWKLMVSIHQHPNGPKDIATLGAHFLALQPHHPTGAIPPPEVDIFIPTLRAAGVQWVATTSANRRKR